ncbi:FG-GAP repeat protein [Leisingera sp. ANG-M1]|uniref:FG-GAP repeat protein n=1 Tax=Leisingera sp. ANG-M1 TaxID=1577895 RepID=UPI00068B03D4|nr:FG-GAP repeat protein [Leisingera sp. ANG-M1]
MIKSFVLLGEDAAARGGSAEEFGTSVALGDTNADGISEMLIGGPETDFGQAQNAGVFLLTTGDLAAADGADGSRDNQLDIARLVGTNAYHFSHGAESDTGFGETVAFADVDGDGRDDVIIGASFDDTSATNAGAVYIFLGDELAAADAADGDIDGRIDTSQASYTLYGNNEANLLFGSSIGRLPASFDQIGPAEGLLIGTPGADGTIEPDRGGFWIVSGDDLDRLDALDGTVDGEITMTDDAPRPSFINGTTLVDGELSGDGLGTNVVSVGEVLDSAADTPQFLVSGETHSGGAGVAYLVTATALGAADTNNDGRIDAEFLDGAGGSYRFIGVDTPLEDGLGRGLGTAGDIDGDGLNDLLISATDSEAGSANGGAVYLITSKGLLTADRADGVDDNSIDLSMIAGLEVSDAPAVYRLLGDAPGARLGTDVASAGDWDGDGLGDFLISAPFSAANGGNSTYLVTGAALRLADAADGSADGDILMSNVPGTAGSYRFDGPALGSDDQLGLSVSMAGNIDSDGFGDFLIGAPQLQAVAFENRGGAYVLSGAELDEADALDGTQDGIIDLGLILDDTIALNMMGSRSADQMTGRSGADTLIGKGGNDTISGDRGSDALEGGRGNDVLRGQQNRDTLEGGGGNDLLLGGTGSDRLSGNSGRDTLSGGSGNDQVNGGRGNDRLQGNGGNDDLSGSSGNDRLIGGGGRDTLDGGSGNDILQGGRGADHFIFSRGDDRVLDFGGRDVIDLSSARGIRSYNDLSRNHISQDGSSVLIEDARGNTLELVNTSLSDLSSSDFLF